MDLFSMPQTRKRKTRKTTAKRKTAAKRKTTAKRKTAKKKRPRCGPVAKSVASAAGAKLACFRWNGYG